MAVIMAEGLVQRMAGLMAAHWVRGLVGMKAGWMVGQKVEKKVQ